MKLKLREDPKEWRKITLLSLPPFAIFFSLLFWRHRINGVHLGIALAILAALAIAAVIQPRWFRGYYRSSSRLGFFLSQTIGRVVLVCLFLFVLTPLGLILRACGKDLLRLKPRSDASTYWTDARKDPPLDRMF
jgi:hypothetical protein